MHLRSRRGPRGLRLLSLDWDFFFPVPHPANDSQGLFDWGHREAPFFLDAIWGFRSAAFFRSGVPLPGLSGEERSFWNRRQTAPGATLFLADSHALATDPCVLEGVGHITHLDAHHDAGYGGPASAVALLADGEVDCGNWLLAAMLRGTHAEVVYPTWKPWGVHERPPALPLARRVDDGAPFGEPFDRVFLCRSGAWTPPWVEDAFWDLVDAWPGAGRVWLEDVPRRHWKNQESSAWEMVEQWKTSRPRDHRGAMRGKTPVAGFLRHGP